MYLNLNSLFLVMQIVITVGVRNGLVLGLDIAGHPVPDQCASICTPSSNFYNTCKDLINDPPALISCICTEEADKEFQLCINCVVPIVPSSVSTLKPLIEKFNFGCVGLTPLTLPPTT
jgi:hypothetical protein